MKTKTIVLILASALMSQMTAFAAPSSKRKEKATSVDNTVPEPALPGRCKLIVWRPGDVIDVEASTYKQTHITLPEDTIDVLYGNQELWKTDNIRNHIFVPANN